MFGFRGAAVGGGPLLQFPNNLVGDAANRQLSHRYISNEGAFIEGILSLLLSHEDQGERRPPLVAERTAVSLSARQFRPERR